MQQFLSLAFSFAIVFPAIVLHEVAHGYAAYMLGDDTAKRAGRLSLNPMVHIDIWGTILLPLMLLLTTHMAIGWAKPVPINPWNFKDRKTGMLITGIAGPATNLALAAFAGLVSRVIPAGSSSYILGVFSSFYDILIYFAYVNLLLLFFNLIPIPPLDGSRVVQRLLSGKAAAWYDSLERYGFIIIFGIFFVAPQVFNVYLAVTVMPLFRIITGIALV